MFERKDKWSVGEWMTPEPRTVPPDLPVRAAFFTMRRKGFRHLVVEEDGRLAGIVTDRDLRRPDLTDDPDGWHDFYRLDGDYEVRHVMTREVVTLSPGDRLEKAVNLMIEKRFGAFPVVDKNGHVIGILSSLDLLRAFQSTLGRFAERMRATGG